MHKQTQLQNPNKLRNLQQQLKIQKQINKNWSLKCRMNSWQFQEINQQ